MSPKDTFKLLYILLKNKGISHTIRAHISLLSLISHIASGILSSTTTRRVVGKPSASLKKK